MDTCPHGPNCDRQCLDPNIDNGIMTKVWGPPGWLFLHCVTHGYPYAINDHDPKHVLRREYTRQFFHLVGEVFPCVYCRDSYRQFISRRPIEPHLKTRAALTRWLYDIHNMVNDKLGVPQCKIPSYEEVYQRMEQYRAKCTKTTPEERSNNLAKGCVVPASGVSKRCVIDVVDHHPSQSYAMWIIALLVVLFAIFSAVKNR